MTPRCACGTPTPGTRLVTHSPGTQATCPAWRSAPTAPASHPVVTTTRCGVAHLYRPRVDVVHQAHHQHEPPAVAGLSPDIDYFEACPGLPIASDRSC